MRTLADIMKGYLEEDARLPVRPLNEISAWLPSRSNDCPITPSVGTWETVSDPTRYKKKFEFSDQQSLVMFVNEIFAYQAQVQHQGKITIDADDVMIEVYTHDVNTVTEIDQEYTHEVDNIFIDVQYSTGIEESNNEW